MKKRYVFNIPGAPVRVFKSDDEGRQPLDTYIENKIRYIVNLENQYEENNILEKPIEATFTFYLPKNHKYRQNKVSIVELFKFANNIAQGIVYKKDYLLYNVNMTKQYSNNPHTEIIIETVDKIKGGFNEARKKKKKKLKKK